MFSNEQGTSAGVSSEGFSGSISARYEHLIDIPFTQEIRHNLVSLFSYFDNFAPKWKTLHIVVSVFRLLQFLGPSFIACCTTFWGEGTVQAEAISILSVTFHLVPVKFRNGFRDTVSMIFSIYSALFFGYLIGASFYLKKTSKLSKFTTYFLNLNLSTFGFLLPPIAIENIGELISVYITGSKETTVVSIVFIVISLLFVTLYVWITTTIYGNTLLFRQTSLQSIQSRTQITLVVCTFIVTIVSGIQFNLSRIGQAVICLCCIPVYGIYFFFTLTNVTFIHDFISQICMAFSLTGMLITCYEGVLLLLNKSIGDAALMVDIALILITYVLSNIIHKRRVLSNLYLLDEYCDSNETSRIDTFRRWLQTVDTGFKYSHSACLDYSIMRLATDAWPYNVNVWEVYAKYAAIYPENTRILLAISQSIQSLRLKGEGIESVISEIGTILKLRESNYSPELKSKLTRIQRTVVKAKNRLRNIWDDVLQGNLKDINEAVQHAYESVLASETEYNYILMQYPNNRFVARAYSMFLSEVKADSIQSAKWRENVKLLQKGILISPDSVHELAATTYPDLPFQVGENMAANQCMTMTMTDEFTTDEFTTEADASRDSQTILIDLINQHKVQGVTNMVIGTIILLILIYIVPFVLLILTENYTDKLNAPLVGIYGTAYLRTLNCLISAFCLNYVLVKSPHTDFIDVTTNGLDLAAFGNEHDIKGILGYLCKTIIDSTHLLTDVRNYMVGNEHMDRTRKYLFDETCPFYYMTNVTYNETSYMSADVVTVRLANQVAQVVEKDTFSKDELKSPMVLTCIYNYIEPSKYMDKALDETSEFVIDMNNSDNRLYTIIMIVFMIFNVLVYVIVYPIVVHMLNVNRAEVNRSLTHVSKNVISQISSSLTSLKKKNNETETESSGLSSGDVNKQEESIIKLFNSCTDTGNDYLLLVIQQTTCIIIVIGCACGAIAYACTSLMGMSDTMAYSSPHINYMFGVPGATARIFGSLSLILIEKFFGIPGVLNDLDYQLSEMEEQITLSDQWFAYVRFGNNDLGVSPLSTIQSDIEEVKKYIHNDEKDKAPATFTEGISRFEAGSQQYLVNALIKNYLTKMKLDPPVYPNVTKDLVGDVWQHSAIMLYGAFYYEVSSKLLDSIDNDIGQSSVPMILLTIGLFLVSAIFSVIIIVLALDQKKYIIFTLKLFLHCPTETILQSPKIMKLLKGNYGNSSDDFATKHMAFYVEVVNKLQDFIIVAEKESKKVTMTNDAFNRIFGDAPENLEDFIMSDIFEGEKKNMESKPTTLTYKNKDGEVQTTLLTLITTGNFIIADGRDMSLNVQHEKLIEFERKKSDSMLASILPASLVPRVQAGESNISFSVQSVSVSFIDIVEFTPWCGSHKADYVMRTLNTIFKRFDAIIAQSQTLTKIKCIGDCYMSAGGIFDEVNQPAVHARELVDFGCQAINTISQLDEEINETLRIRCGVNTGGPIVAGVLGTAKPTFEILGPPINIAQQMEHFGVPMQVHISRPVYELIYGGSFNIKERGEIEIKKGKVSTYLVTPPPVQPSTQ